VNILRLASLPVGFLAAVAVSSLAAQPLEEYEISVRYETETLSEGGGSGSSRGGYLYR